MNLGAVLLAAVALPAFAQYPCTMIEGDQIRAIDLARAIPAFKTIPADTPLAPSALPGGSRVFTASELQTLAARFSVAADSFPNVCFQILTEPLARDRVLEAMRASLQIPGVHIELLEVSAEKTPRGRIEFPREGLGTPALADRKSPVLWRGAVIYGSAGQRFPVWGRVTVTAPVSRVVAAENLKSGIGIQPGQLRPETVEIFPVIRPVMDPEQIVGMLPLHTIPAGAEIRRDNLAAPIDIHRGDRVQVEVRIGAARLALSARAESNGRVGDTIPVVNPDSSKTFHARVEGKDKVVVEIASMGRQ